jgi:hypothetical protein
MNAYTCRRAAIFAALLAAPALIALGAADTSKADAAATNTGPTVSHHEAFPQQHNTPQPGTSVHHHHQHQG